MEKNIAEELYKIQLADAAIEVGANLIINFGTSEIKMTLDALKQMNEKGIPSDVFNCIMLSSIVYGGMTPDESLAFVKEGLKNGELPNIVFDAPEGGALNLTTPENAPTFNQLVELMQGE